MEPTGERLLGSLGVQWMDVGLCYLRELKLNPRRVKRRVRREFESAIIDTYRDVLYVALTDGDADLFAICSKLEKDKSVMSRWRRGVVKPNWDALCLAVAAFDVDLGQRFPRGRQAVVAAIAKTLNCLRVDFLRGKSRVLHRGELACLHYASLSGAWWKAQKTRDATHLAAATKAIARKVAREVPSMEISQYQEVENVIEAWGVEWFVFHEAISYRWEYYL
jgi:hypothetical protein